MTIFDDFIRREHMLYVLYVPQEMNLLLAATNEVNRYLRYAEIALARHVQLSAQFVAVTKEFIKGPLGASAITPSQRATLEAAGALQTLMRWTTKHSVCSARSF